MEPAYRHAQVGYPLAAVLVVAVVVVSSALVASSTSSAWVDVALAVGFAIAFFPRLTTEVHAGYVQCTFGLGLVRRRVFLRDISVATVVRSSPFYGWGLRWIPNGWLWNVAGLDAVELQLSSGRRFLIGTDEPEKLAAAILQMKRAG